MKFTNWILSALLATGALGLTGCKPADTATGDATSAAESAADDHGHDHSGTDHSEAGHGHGVGPHDGTIADWGGGKFHVEFTVDHNKTEATVYVLGGDEKTAAPIAAESIELTIIDPEMQVTLKPSPQESDPDGTASRFVGTHEKLGVVQEYAGTMTGVIDGTPYTGEFKEEAHTH
ncbi:hypothetical protein [Rosistilla oblonga]|uniref:Uncharacterized protein n=1 Tax=Rosistilla oblonga TaxID=2527990 RepID=A0A518IUT0_9BACT|nr:hypothetical protein [Rosistilla oblonga]QDV56835.1 hypothetical protein Mal33_28360 [Rosistilla oblonga]